MPTGHKKMIDVLIALLSLGIGYFVGFNQSRIREQIDKLKVIEPTPAVTDDHPKLINENYQSKTDVGIATPKSPQLLEWEAEQKLRTLNDSYRVKPE